MDGLAEEKCALLVSDSIGTVSGLISLPANPLAMLVLAHGAGAGMQHPFMYRVAHELVSRHIGIIRYNFPFIEHKKRRPDPPAVATATVMAVIDYAARQFPGLSLYAGGKSFGGRMTSQCIAKDGPRTVKGVVFLGFPLHPTGKPNIERAAHLKQVTIPMLFLQGSNDALAVPELVEQVCSNLYDAKLVNYPGADHSFKSPGQDLIPLLASQIASWIAERNRKIH
jgi:hypothetical protein